jgi:hypothetical protein
VSVIDPDVPGVRVGLEELSTMSTDGAPAVMSGEDTELLAAVGSVVGPDTVADPPLLAPPAQAGSITVMARWTALPAGMGPVMVHVTVVVPVQPLGSTPASTVTPFGGV